MVSDMQTIETSSVTSIQPVTALSFLQLPSFSSATSPSLCHISSSLLLAGEGPYVKIFSTATGKLLRTKRIFHKERIHGICVERTASPSPQLAPQMNDAGSDDNGLCHGIIEGLDAVLIVFWGSQKLVIANLGDIIGDDNENEVGNPPDGHDGSTVPTLTEITANDWIQNAVLIPRPDSSMARHRRDTKTTSERDYLVAAITAHNALLYFDVLLGKCIGEVRFPEKCILYSAALTYVPVTEPPGPGQSGFEERLGRILVAAGTVFGDILVWSTTIGTAGFEPSGGVGERPVVKSIQDLPRAHISPIVRQKSGDSQYRRSTLLGDGEPWERVEDEETWDKVETRSIGISDKENPGSPLQREKMYSRTNACPKLHYRLKGHEGSIFGVNISPRYYIPSKPKTVRYLASCSDDRTVRVWDISRCDSQDMDDIEGSGRRSTLSEWNDISLDASIISINTTGFLQQSQRPSSLAFEKVPESPHQVATGWGHGARIWRVRFLKKRPTEDEIRIVSVSEDLTSKLWSFRPEKSNRLTTLETIQMHSGKNIWSMAVDERWGLLATGGADSRVAMVEYGSTGIHRLEWDFEAAFSSSILSTLGDSLPLTKELDANSNGFRNYTVVDKHRILVNSNNGHLLTYLLPDAASQLSQDGIGSIAGSWRLHARWPRLTSYASIAAWEGTGLVCVGDSNGHIGIIDLDTTVELDGHRIIWWKAHEGSISGLFCEHQGGEFSEIPLFENFSNGGIPDLFYLVSYSLRENVVHLHLFPNPRRPHKGLNSESENSPPRMLKTIVLLPPENFEMTTSFYLDFIHGLLYLGSRTGILAVFDVFDGAEKDIILNPLESWRRYHGKDAITCIIGYPNPHTGPKIPRKEGTDPNERRVSRVLTTGRNGVYVILDLEISATPTTSAKRIHRTTFQVQLLVTSNSSAQGGGTGNPIIEGAYLRGQDLIIYGFKGRCFFIWNETKGYELFTEDCGGPKRSWCFYEAGKHNEEDEVGWLVWTRAGKMHSLTIDKPLRSVLQLGHHGREIKALAISNPPVDYAYPYYTHPRVRILATGSEDTTIRLSYLQVTPGELSVNDPAATLTTLSKVSTITTFKKHSTGIQHLAWSSCGGWLFSSGGVEEFYVWRVKRLNDAQHEGPMTLGVKCEAACPTQSTVPDLRITSFDVTTVNIDGFKNERAFLITMVYSDSSIKVWLYDPYKRSFQLLISGKYKTSCLLNVKHLIYNIPETRSTPVIKPLFFLVICGTDGHLCVYDITLTLVNKTILPTRSGLTGSRNLLIKPSPIKILKSTPDWSRQVHQSGIKSLEIIRVNSSGDGPILVVTGGDDCALCVTAFEVRLVPVPSSLHEVGDRLLQYRQYGAATLAFEAFWLNTIVKEAHASALTAVVPISRNCEERSNTASILLITSGIDQIISKWQIEVTKATSGKCSVNLDIVPAAEDVCTRRSPTRFTHVADIACAGILEEEIVKDRRTGKNVKNVKVVLAGVGMDVRSFNTPANEGSRSGFGY